MIRIAIVEDKPADAECIRSYLTRYSAETGTDLLTQTFSEGETFLSRYGNGFDIVFMDIEMPGCDGMETAERLRAIDDDVCLLFITRLANYAIRGYTVRALDYLIKPVDYATFAGRVSRAIESCRRSHRHEIVISTTNGIKRIFAENLYYVEVMNHTVVYHTREGNFSVRGSIKDCEQSLSPYDFVRCNNSFLVNLRHVSEVQGNELMINGETLPIGRTKKQDFMRRFAEYLGDAML